MAASENAQTVRTFLEALQAGDLDAALPLLTEDAVWINVSLPAVRGRNKIERINRLGLEKLGGGFRVHFHNIAAEGDTVLTERTDAIRLGRVEQRFWVYGRFEMRDGRIAVWRDSFDWGDIVVSLLRGIAGAFVPSLNRRWPGDS
jgi:limonene-1,2-epoxide hydrolase